MWEYTLGKSHRCLCKVVRGSWLRNFCIVFLLLLTVYPICRSKPLVAAQRQSINLNMFAVILHYLRNVRMIHEHTNLHVFLVHSLTTTTTCNVIFSHFVCVEIGACASFDCGDGKILKAGTCAGANCLSSECCDGMSQYISKPVLRHNNSECPFPWVINTCTHQDFLTVFLLSNFRC